LQSTKQKCRNCGNIIDVQFSTLVPPLWKFVPSGDEDHQILKFNNSECIVLSHTNIRIELSDLLKSGYSGRIDIFDNGTLIESIKVRNIFQDYLIQKYKNKRKISLGSEMEIPRWTEHETRAEEVAEDEEGRRR
jgi:hypothetical protein